MKKLLSLLLILPLLAVCFVSAPAEVTAETPGAGRLCPRRFFRR